MERRNEETNGQGFGLTLTRKADVLSNEAKPNIYSGKRDKREKKKYCNRYNKQGGKR